MGRTKYFYQDFLFENMPVDKQEFPDVTLKYIKRDLCHDVEFLSFDRLMRMNKKMEWDSLHSNTVDKTVVIQDDIPIANKEMHEYKDFYLKAYYSDLSKYCNSCYILDES